VCEFAKSSRPIAIGTRSAGVFGPYQTAACFYFDADICFLQLRQSANNIAERELSKASLLTTFGNIDH
jgi:hypothetical protein